LVTTDWILMRRAAAELEDAEVVMMCDTSDEALAAQARRHPHTERTHDLSEFLYALRVGGCELSALDDDCALLTTHAVAPRYPAGLNLGDEDANAAVAAAERVAVAVRALLPPRVH